MLPYQVLSIVNLIFCLIIFSLGLMHYQKSGKILSFYIAIAFGLFGLPSLAELFNITNNYLNVLILFQSLGFVLVIFALYSAYNDKRK